MAVEAKVKWTASINDQQVINSYNRILAKQQKQLDKLKETVRESKKATKAGKQASRLVPNFAKQIIALATVSRAIGFVNRALREGLEIDRQALANLSKQKNTRIELAQLASGQDKPLNFPQQLVNAARTLALRNALPFEEAQSLVFALQSRVPDATPQELAAFKSINFLVDKVQGVSLAADAQRQFPDLPQGLEGIRKILGGLLVGAIRSKLTLNQLAPILAKPSQSAQELGLDFAEVVAGAAAGAAGVAEANEQATQARALFSDILRAKTPGTERLKNIAKDEGLVALLKAINELTESQKLLAFTNKRSFQAALFLSKDAQRGLIERGIKDVREGVKFAGEGGNKDVLQKQARLLEADVDRQIIRVPIIAAERKKIALQRAGAPAREAIRAAIVEEVDMFSIDQEGTGVGANLRRFGGSLRRGFISTIRDPGTDISLGIQQVRNIEERKLFDNIFADDGAHRRPIKEREALDRKVTEAADVVVLRLEKLIFLLARNDDETGSATEQADRIGKDIGEKLGKEMSDTLNNVGGGAVP